jgi:hypothetical protein
MAAPSMTALYITAYGDHLEHITDDQPSADLKPLVAEAVGAPVRRVGRFIQLALIAAGRCSKRTALPSNAAVYLGSGRGDLEVTIEVMQSLMRDGQAPKPLSFINTVSNAACFYVAQNLKLMGQSSFVCNRYFAFESVLQLAALDLATGAIDTALVGTVDVVVPPLAGHRIRLGLGADALVADASHWLGLTTKPSTDTLGRVIATEHFCDVAALQMWLATQAIDASWCLATGQFMPPAEAADWQTRLGLEVFDYRSNLDYYDSQSGAVVGAFVRSKQIGTLLHLNRDPSGRYSAMVVERSPTGRNCPLSIK